MRRNYNFTDGVRSKYADRFKEGAVIVLLEPDVAKGFPDAKSVNETLRRVMRNRKLPAGRASKNTG